MKKIYIILIPFLAACSTSPDSETVNHITHLSTDTVKPLLVEAITDTVVVTEEKIVLEVDLFSITNMEANDTHEYGEGDCFGEVVKYAGTEDFIAVDQSSCGDYGYVNTNYLLDSSDFVQAIYVVDCGLEINYESDISFYVLTERMILFENGSSTVMVKSDTVGDASIQEIDKPFVSDTLQDSETKQEYWQQLYNGLWKQELDR